MIVLSLTEEDRALLLPLTPEQRDQIFLGPAHRGWGGSSWGKMEEETLEAIPAQGRPQETEERVQQALLQGACPKCRPKCCPKYCPKWTPPFPFPFLSLFGPLSSPLFSPPEPPLSTPPYNPPLFSLSFPISPGCLTRGRRPVFPVLGRLSPEGRKTGRQEIVE